MLIENAVGLMSVPLKPFIINELIKSNLRTLIMLAGMAAAVPSRSGQYSGHSSTSRWFYVIHSVCTRVY